MSEELNQVTFTTFDEPEQAAELVGKLFAVTQPGAVFSAPATVGDHTVITASEVQVGMGFGFGSGTGARAVEDEPEGVEPEVGYGSGGGGGGYSSGRPVAVISIDAGGVHVEPVVDVTKLGLAFFTMLGSMFMMWRKMRQAARG